MITGGPFDTSEDDLGGNVPLPTGGGNAGGTGTGGGVNWNDVNDAINDLNTILGATLGTPGTCGFVSFAQDGPMWCGMSQTVADWVHYYAPQDFFNWIRSTYPTSAPDKIDGWKLRMQTMELSLQHLYLWLMLSGWGPVTIYKYPTQPSHDPKFPQYYKPAVTEASYQLMGIDFWPTVLSDPWFGGPGFQLHTLATNELPTSEAMARQHLSGGGGSGGGGGTTDERTRPRQRPSGGGDGGGGVDTGGNGTTSTASAALLPIALLFAGMMFSPNKPRKKRR